MNRVNRQDKTVLLAQAPGDGHNGGALSVTRMLKQTRSEHSGVERMLDEKDGVAVVQQFGRTYRAFMTAFQACVGLPLLQWRILMMLRDLPSAQPQKTLVEMLDVDAGALTRQLQQMEQKGWLTRSVDERDNRLTNVALAEKGRQKISEAAPLRDAFLADATHSLSAEMLSLMEKTMTLFESRIKEVAARRKSVA